MNNIKNIYLLIFFSFFPVWILRSDLIIQEILLSLLIFLLIPILIFYFVIKKIAKQKINFLLLLVSLIFIYGLDNHLGLRSGMLGLIYYFTGEEEWLAGNFGIYKYLVSCLFLLALSLVIFFIAQKTDEKIIKILLITIITITVFNAFDNSKNYNEIVYFEKNSKLNNFKKVTLVIIFDEMSGIDSYESEGPNGEKFTKFSEYFFTKYKFNVYRKASSISGSTVTTIVNMTNFRNDIQHNGSHYSDSSNIDGYIEATNTYYQSWKQLKNLFFGKFNQISVHQGMTTNYCEIKNVNKCDTFNPFKQRRYMQGFKNSALTRVISVNQMNGSIIGRIIWRALRHIRIIDSIAIPEGEKPAFTQTLKKIEKDIDSLKYDLIFVHTLVPHAPYGYDEKCEYDGGLSFNTTFMTEKNKIKIHNNERICILKFLDSFLNNLKSKNRLDELDIIILSDHGARINSSIRSSNFSTILAYRDSNTEYINYDFKITTQDFFKKKFDQN